MTRTYTCLLMVAVLTPCVIAQTNTLTRDRDPVVLTGVDLSALQGLVPGDVVAFRYEGGWQQIPVQIDERKVVDFIEVYGYGPAGHTVTAYADPNTYCGADGDPTFDADDELVFMTSDAADRAAPGAGIPIGCLPDTGLELAVTDPVDGGAGYVYLFQTDGSLTPDAGASYVTYAFNLLAGPYIPNYNTITGPNPEDSEIITPHYRTRFSDRWICDELNVYTGGATGVDILDRHKVRLKVGECGRTEEAFSVEAHNWPGEGAFFINKSGPVRAIRSYMGANSGVMTQREHHFYAQRQDVTTFLRVHAIEGVMDYTDYSPNAIGMSYYNSLNQQGVLIDGDYTDDTLTGGPIVWEMVTGAQGSLIIAHLVETDIDPFPYGFYYMDAINPVYNTCTGDPWEYGASGVWVTTPIPNTDPTFFDLYGEVKNLAFCRVVYYEAPGQSVQTAALRYDQASTPLDVEATAYQPGRTLLLSVYNAPFGQVLVDPEPNEPADANLMVFAPDTIVTLTAEPNDGKVFEQWLIFDPNFPGDANHAATDTNAVLQLVMDKDWQVQASFRCANGVSQALPILVVGLVALGLLSRRSWRRS